MQVILHSIAIWGNYAMYSIVMYQCNKVYSHFELYEMDVLKYKIRCGNKTKFTFRQNKNSSISLSVALKVKKIGLM